MKMRVLGAAIVLSASAVLQAQAPSHFAEPNPNSAGRVGGWGVPGWDNGLPDGVNGFSNGEAGAIGADRRLAEDFVVPVGRVWTFDQMLWRSVWDTSSAGAGTGSELIFVEDAGGSPAFSETIETANIWFYEETATGDVLFSRPEVEHYAVFDRVTFVEGTYWINHRVLGPDNNFMLTSPNIGSDCWVNYDDLGVMSCGEQFGNGPFGLAFALVLALPVELTTFEIE